MIAKSLYTFLFLILLPISLSLIFKPGMWQNFYSSLYLSRSGIEESSIFKVIARSFLAMISTELGALIHRVIGALLALVALYIFLNKLGGGSFLRG